MTLNYIVLILLLSSVPRSFCLNALFISSGAAGHVIPMFELAKTMKNHNVTFVTQQFAQTYIDFKPYSSSTFRVVYTNDSPDALAVEKNNEHEAMSYFANYSTFDALSYVIPQLGQIITSILNKTIHILMFERFDVIVAGAMVVGVPVLCEKANTPCVTHSPAFFPNILDFNLPNVFSLLTSKELTQITYRIYNVAFTMRMITKLAPKMIPLFYTLFQSLPRVSGPFHDSFTLRNLRSSQSKCLKLISVPHSFYTPSYSHHGTKYMGAFMDEKLIDDVDNALTKWMKSKPVRSVVYGAFGSTSVIPHDRMYNLISGLAAFLLEADGSSLLLVFRSTNYDTFQAVLKELDNDEFTDVLNNDKRVRIENGFVQQKWILQQGSVKVFLSHCGMGSCLEALHCGKPILCMPFNMDQFANAMRIEDLGVGHSLFVPPSALQSLINPYDFVQYTFTVSRVTNTISALWMNETYEKAARLMSLEIKHSGGLKRAVEEIEFFVHLGGDLGRFAPFQSTLSLYQRYMLDLLLIFVTLPGVIVIYIIFKCSKRRQKQKID
ncbi:unnamed protein product [Didymodactylos carnosus]|uniref:Glucuronosyltransferase n=1 Tax=Didymodactylos carnosus TaxID=1234261 RepID=A0A8S2MCA0_9BILA|nr:unnamed protein product [Didymodactylos carnosus]CAF3944788.1 unnamed protein product [Didymodactylos carnosus]